VSWRPWRLPEVSGAFSNPWEADKGVFRISEVSSSPSHATTATATATAGVAVGGTLTVSMADHPVASWLSSLSGVRGGGGSGDGGGSGSGCVSLEVAPSPMKEGGGGCQSEEEEEEREGAIEMIPSLCTAVAVETVTSQVPRAGSP
jgi:hypothetical protein